MGLALINIFISDTDAKVALEPIESAGSRKLCSVVDMLEGRVQNREYEVFCETQGFCNDQPLVLPDREVKDEQI